MQRTRLTLELGDQRVGGVAPMPAGQALAEELMLGEHVGEHAGDARERVGHREQAKRVPGGRGVDDDLVARGGGREPVQLDETDQLVDTRQREREQAIDVVLVQVGAARGDRA